MTELIENRCLEDILLNLKCQAIAKVGFSILKCEIPDKPNLKVKSVDDPHDY
jgi:hypothetical protein